MIEQQPVVEQSASLIWMHGLGDSADGWASLMPQVDAALPDGLRGSIRWICPNAPTRPITLNGGMQMPGWFDIYSLSSDGREDAQGLQEAVEQIEAIIDREVESGVPSERIIIGGFSQGGALAQTVVLRSGRPLLGCVAFSSWLPLGEKYPAALGQHGSKAKFLLAHGDADMVVSHEWGERSHAKLQEMGVDSRFVTAPDVGHGADALMLREMLGFLVQNLKQAGTTN